MDRAVAELVTQAALEAVRAKIVLPPRKLKVYLDSYFKKMRQLDSDASKLKKRFDYLDEHEEALLSGLEVEGKDRYDYVRFIDYLARKRSGKSLIADHIESVELSFEVLRQKSSTVYDIGNVTSRLGWIKEFFKDNWNRDILDIKGTSWIQHSLKDYQDYYYEDTLKENDALKKEDLLLFASVIKQAKDLEKFTDEAIERIGQIKEQAVKKTYDDDWKPDMSDTETMYHASVDAKKIVRKGFDKVVPSVKGLGGSQSDKSHKNAISFTSDLYVAKEIMRALKEAIMVARGDVKARHISEWADKAGIKDKVINSAFNTFLSAKNREKMEDPETAFGFFMAYLYHSKRYNPVFFGMPSKFVKMFKSLNPRQVGIVVAKVDTTHKDIMYLSSMQEYRIPPEAVVKIEKVIS